MDRDDDDEPEFRPFDWWELVALFLLVAGFYGGAAGLGYLLLRVIYR